jgi:hypothetical protein
MKDVTLHEHPWQSGPPAELIRYAIKLLRNDENLKKDASNLDEYMFVPDEPDIKVIYSPKLMAFLILDIGVESLLRVYLGLPAEVTKAKVDHFIRCKASNGKFYEVVDCVSKCIGKGFENIDLDHVKHYHNLRNKLYHEGDSLTVPTSEVFGYANLAVKLLKILIDVDLSEELAIKEATQEDSVEREIKHPLKNTSPLLNQLNEELVLCIEIIKPKLLYPSYRYILSELNQDDPLTTMWMVCGLIEEVFNVDFENCLSNKDIEKANVLLRQVSGYDITQYPSKKEVVIRLLSRSFEVGDIEIINLPVGNYSLSSLKMNDFLMVNNDAYTGDLFKVYLKIVCEIIDKEIAGGVYKNQLNSLMEIVTEYDYFIGIAYIILIDRNEEEVNEVIRHLCDAIRNWRIERL